MHRLAGFTLLSGMLVARLLVTWPAGAGGGWSNDPGQNLAIADRPDDQVQVKIGRASDGGLYVSWYDNAEGGYDLALQRLDGAGIEQWPHNGIGIADTSFAWTTDYGLAITADDAALLAFRDDRGGGEHIAAALVSPDGSLLWGAQGIRLDSSTEPSDFLGPPQVVETTDRQIVVGWTHGSDIRLRRLDRAGNPLWNRDVVFQDPQGAQQMLADLQPTSDGGVIVSWVRTESFLAPRHLCAQKLSRDGLPLWGPSEPNSSTRRALVIFDGGTLQYGNFPEFIADSEGGAVFAWYETDPLLQARVQHVRADGSLRFGPNGVPAASPAPELERVEPALAYDPLSGDIYVFWREMPHSGPLAQAVVGQRFAGDAAGQPTWGSAGKVFEPAAAHEVSQLSATAFRGGVLLAYVEKLAEGDQRVWIRRLDPAGNSVWPSERVAVSTVPSVKSRLTMAISHAGFAVLGWQDKRAGNEDIYLQNVNADGSLGAATTPATPFEPRPTPTGQPTLEPSPPSTPATEPAPTRSPGEGRLYLPALNRQPLAGQPR